MTHFEDLVVAFARSRGLTLQETRKDFRGCEGRLQLLQHICRRYGSRLCDRWWILVRTRQNMARGILPKTPSSTTSFMAAMMK
jgi:hypothetical protein